MRKIISKSDENKKKKRNQTILGIFLVIIMFGSVFGIVVNSFGDENSVAKKINYNGFEFVNSNGFWILADENYEFTFRYNPNEVEKVYSEIKNLDNYYSKPLYIFSDSEEAESEIYRNLFYDNQIIQRMQKACLNYSNLSIKIELNCNKNLPVKTCEDNFIIINKGEISKITQKNNCVFIEGQNLTMLSDEFLFKILGIEQ